ncbi:hypothetical protein SELMODRAFT_411774 [Selaginella moellendorffii]|uniref:Uncharacterized protein n=1 Tax=Selaginella moellendorffii TaxID=88036 RepID=D8RJ02_SELML|nr:hypothetical protein SELMODRAFT_411774 [Selaginella moellendorffii]
MKKDVKLPRAFDEGLYNEMSLWMTWSIANVLGSHRVDTSMGSTIANESPGYETNATANPDPDVIFETQDPRDANEDIPKVQVGGKKVSIATRKKRKCTLKGSDDRRVAMMLQGTHMMYEELQLLRQPFVESMVTKENILEFWGFARLFFLVAMVSLCGSVASKAMKLARAAALVLAKKARTRTADREEAWILKITVERCWINLGKEDEDGSSILSAESNSDQSTLVASRFGINRQKEIRRLRIAQAPSLDTDNHQRELDINHHMESASPLL